MMDAYHAHRALGGLDEGCGDYIAYAQNAPKEEKAQAKSDMTLHTSVVKGMVKEAAALSEELLKTVPATEVIDGCIIPALSEIGEAFEKGKAFLPQLLMSAEAATAAFAAVKRALPKGSADKGRVILATVKGDIHDIGKNIVKVLLESYGFGVTDLGKDVSPERILEEVKTSGCRLVGLSALMTTTVPAMAETIALLHREVPDTRVVVGGAVLTQEYADSISADKYCRDAMETVAYATEYYNK